MKTGVPEESLGLSPCGPPPAPAQAPGCDTPALPEACGVQRAPEAQCAHLGPEASSPASSPAAAARLCTRHPTGRSPGAEGSRGLGPHSLTYV